MSDFMDHLPSKEKERIRKKMRSPEAYERLRDKVKGPEDLEQEMKKSEQLAELHFALESDHAIAEQLKAMVEKDVSEQGIEKMVDVDSLSPEMKQQIEAGKFTLAVSAHPSTQEDVVTIIPEGNMQEKIPLKTSFSDKYSGNNGRPPMMLSV